MCILHVTLGPWTENSVSPRAGESVPNPVFFQHRFLPQLLLLLISQQMVQFSGLPTLQKSYRMRKVHLGVNIPTFLNRHSLNLSNMDVVLLLTVCDMFIVKQFWLYVGILGPGIAFLSRQALSPPQTVPFLPGFRTFLPPWLEFGLITSKNQSVL